MKPESVLVCKPVATGPAHVPSFEDRCAKCGQRVWRSHGSVIFTGVPWCVPCTIDAAADEGKIMAIVPEFVVEDLREYLRTRGRDRRN